MMTDTPYAGTPLGNPAWLAHRYDPTHDAVHFVSFDRAARNKAPFLTDAEMGPATPMILARADAVGTMPAPAPLHFIFHSAYCCSTLLARALDVPGVATALKEPQILNDLVGWRHRGAPSVAVVPVLSASLDLLARPFEAGEKVIIKPSNVVNGLIGPILRARPSANAILLYAPLPSFVASIARKGLWGRLWVRDLLSKQLLDGLVQLGFEQRDYFLLTDLQVAAVGWLAQHALFTRIANAAPDRVAMLDSETLIAEPRDTLTQIARRFGLDLQTAAIEDIVTREFARDAKTGRNFTSGQRAREREAGQAVHRDEIDKVAIWAAEVAKAAGVVMPAPVTG